MSGVIEVRKDDVILIQGTFLYEPELERIAVALTLHLGFKPHLLCVDAPGAAVTVLRGKS